jgi:hypothetical protein
LGFDTASRQPSPFGQSSYSVFPPVLSSSTDAASLVACHETRSSVRGTIHVSGREDVHIDPEPVTYRVTAELRLVNGVWKTIEQAWDRVDGTMESCVSDETQKRADPDTRGA